MKCKLSKLGIVKNTTAAKMLSLKQKFLLKPLRKIKIGGIETSKITLIQQPLRGGGGGGVEHIERRC